MNELSNIPAKPKSGQEYLTDNGKEIEYQLYDFWRWSVSDLLSNAIRGRFAEFIVGTAVGLNPNDLRDEWDAFDIKTDSGIKIEVKSAAYVQSWEQKQFSKITFSIKKARFWESEKDLQRGEPQRHADIYVFCHLKHKDQKTINPLMLEQWDFYVLPTITLDNYERSKHSITLNSLRKLTQYKEYSELKTAIEDAYRIQNRI